MRSFGLGLLLFFVATFARAADDPVALTGDWKLARLGEKETPQAVEATLSVTAEGQVSGSTGVNRYAGRLAKEKKLFGPLIMTRRAGPPAAMQVEAGLTKALDEATRFSIKDKSLTLFAGDSAVAVFERIEKPK